MSRTMSNASGDQTLLMLAFVMLAACIPNMVAGGGIFEAAKPILPTGNSYKLTFKAAGPPPKAGAMLPPVVIVPATSAAKLAGTILQMAVITIEPCGVIGAHLHPRGTEHLYIIQGKLEIGIFFEDGSTKFVMVSAGEGVIIPQGTIHYVRSVGCNKAKVLATFDHPSAGTLFVADSLLKFPEDIRRALFGGTLVKSAAAVFYNPKCSCKRPYSMPAKPTKPMYG